MNNADKKETYYILRYKNNPLYYWKSRGNNKYTLFDGDQILNHYARY